MWLLVGALLHSAVAHAAGAPPAPPAGVQAAAEDRAAKLSWNCFPGFEYFVYASEDGETFDIANDNPVKGCEFRVANLANGKTYHFYVVTVVNGNEGPPSAKVVIVAGAKSGAAAVAPAVAPTAAPTAVPTAVRTPAPVAVAPTPLAPRKIATPSRPRGSDRHSGVRRPLRSLGQIGLALDAGWNGIAGLGAALSVHLHPMLTLDGGTGLSRFGWKWGARARVNLLKGAVAPFVGAGYTFRDYASELMKDDGGGNPIAYEVGASHFWHLAVGAEWIRASGLTIRGEAGYARLFVPNTTWVEGTPNAAQVSKVDFAYRSGFVAAISIGYLFGR